MMKQTRRTRDISKPSKKIFSGNDIYHLMKRIDGYPGEGSFILVARRVRAHYIRDIPETFYEPFNTYDDLLATIRTNLHITENQVPREYWFDPQVAVRLFESVYSAPNGVLPMPHDDEHEQGQHSIGTFLGCSKSGGLVFFSNTWGEDWGARGTGAVSREYIDRYMTDAWVARSARIGHDGLSYVRLPPPPPDLDQVISPYHVPVLQNVSHIRRQGYVYHVPIYKTSSLHGEDVTIIEVRNSSGLRLAWTHLFWSYPALVDSERLRDALFDCPSPLVGCG